MNLGTTQLGFSLFLRLQPDSRPSMTPRAWIKAYLLGFQRRRRCCCKLGLVRTRGGRPSTVHSTPPSPMYQGSGRGWAPQRQLFTLLRIFEGAHRDEQPP